MESLINVKYDVPTMTGKIRKRPNFFLHKGSHEKVWVILN